MIVHWGRLTKALHCAMKTPTSHAFQTLFRPALLAGRAGIVTGGQFASPAAAFISGSCLRVDGAATNAKRVWNHPVAKGKPEAFNGFHLAQLPRLLRD